VVVLKQAEAGVAIRDLLRKYGISEQTFYRWRKKYGGLEASEVQELKQLREENRRLKGLVADLTLDKQILQEVLSKKHEGPAATGDRRLGPEGVPALGSWRVLSAAVAAFELLLPEP
jgi:putative transposase